MRTGEDRPTIVIITGMSGAGRSSAAKALEDLGWFVVDNLPPSLLPTMADLAARTNGAVSRIAAVVDVRSRAFSTDLKSAVSELGARGAAARMCVPGGRRRHPGPPVRQRPAPAPAAGRGPGRPTASRPSASCCAGSAATPTW